MAVSFVSAPTLFHGRPRSAIPVPKLHNGSTSFQPYFHATKSTNSVGSHHGQNHSSAMHIVSSSVEPVPNNTSAPIPRRNFLYTITLASTACFTQGLLPFPILAGPVTSAYDISAFKNRQPYALKPLSGKLTLFVNVASYCALTPQYNGLVKLYNTYERQGFEIVASPCNQFGSQEPNSDEDICKFAEEKFGARFLLLDKLTVNESEGSDVAPLYRFLRDNAPERTGEKVLWNFEKFLVGPDGAVLRRYNPGVYPKDIEADIQFALEHPGQTFPP